jgi:cysteine-S-conjugate beta-lyase
MASDNSKIATRLAHGGRTSGDHYGFINTPVYRGSTVLFENAAALKNRDARYTYGIHATPSTDSLADLITELEGGKGTVLAPSGMASITTALLALVQAGDHVLVTDSVYRPTRRFADKILATLGVEIEYYDPLIGAGISSLFRDNTRVLFLESPGSQTMEMQDIPALVAAAKSHKGRREIYTIVDNTWATALFFRALDFGVDITLQAGTKYIGGHSDIMLGATTANARAWPLLQRTQTALGMCPGTEEVYLGLRGIRTMDVRLRQHMASALQIAAWLRDRPEVSEVLHPGLPGAPGHDIWARDFKGSCGLFSIIFEPVDEACVDAFLDTLALFGLGYSWGGFESLAIPFDPGTYRSATEWHGKGPAVRFHIGLEDPDDLIADLKTGFSSLGRCRDGNK